MHRAALLKCSQFSPASPNRCSFLIRQWTAAFKERVSSINVALNQMIGCCCFFKIFMLQSRSAHTDARRVASCFTVKFLWIFQHPVHFCSNMKLFVIFPCALAFNKHTVNFWVHVPYLVFDVLVEVWCPVVSLFVILCVSLSSLWILFVSRIQFLYPLSSWSFVKNTGSLSKTVLLLKRT